MTWDLRGKTVLITGAARGIGAETARRAAAAGANVALVGLEPEELERVAAQCGSNTAAFECDVTDWQALEHAVEGTVERFGGIDVVMANAGIAPAGMVRSVDPAAFERTVEINLLGVWRTVRASLPQVIERKGYVLVTASLAAAIHGPGMAAYSAAKAGAEAFADSLRIEVRHLGVDVGVAYFGFIDTDMVRATDAHPALGALRANAGGPIAKTYPVSQSVGRGAALEPRPARAPHGALAALRQGRVRDGR
jgi:NAD(P)-dependent dehydrogenase (short-subunit alcohol dehydrogenase family)